MGESHGTCEETGKQHGGIPRYIKADDIVLKNKGGQPAGNPQGQPKK